MVHFDKHEIEISAGMQSDCCTYQKVRGPPSFMVDL